MSSDETRTCSSCKQTLPRSAYYPGYWRRGERKCRACERARRRRSGRKSQSFTPAEAEHLHAVLMAALSSRDLASYARQPVHTRVLRKVQRMVAGKQPAEVIKLHG